MRAPVWVGFLRTSLGGSLDALGRLDLVLSLGSTLVGTVMHVDLAVAVGLILAVVLLLRIFVLIPAAMWAEAEKARRAPSEAPINLKIEAGGVANINYYAAGAMPTGEPSISGVPTAGPTGATGTAYPNATTTMGEVSDATPGTGPTGSTGPS